MYQRNTSILVIAFMCLCMAPVNAQNVVVYSNQFITPITTPSIATWCQLDFSPDPVNSLWQGTGLGTSSGEFVNTATVETILITGPADVYDDPSGIGGDFSIGMLHTGWGDKLGLLIDTEGLPFVNLAMDVSAINTTCGGPLPMDTAVFLLELLDAPNGVFDISSGLVLDADTLIGTGPNPDSFVFNWAHATGSLDVSASTDGMVAVRITLIQSSYASFDNLYIEASEDSVITSLIEPQRRYLSSFPLPCTDQLTIKGLSAQAKTAIIQNMLGQQIGVLPILSENRIDVSNLSPGLYIASFKEGEIINTLRFVKE